MYISDSNLKIDKKQHKINKMKANKIFNLFSFALVAMLAISCVSDDEYDVPPIGGEEPDVEVNSSIEAARNAFIQNYNDNGAAHYTFPTGSDLYFEAYVVSSDYAGNFYKTLVVQDAAENPEYGVEILIDKTSLSERYEVGRKVYVLLDGLSITYDDGDDDDPNDNVPGRYTIGSLVDDQVDDISSFLYENHVLRSLETATIEPKVISLDQFVEKNINLFVQIPEMQFTVSELGKTYAGEPEDEFDGMRSLVSCATSSTATMQTSTFSDFKSYTVAEGRGDLNAVLMKDYFADEFVLVINNPTDLDFSNETRCDPVFVETFDDAVDGQDFQFEGWLNYAEVGGAVWTEQVYRGNGYAEFTAFRSGNPVNIGWLITPGIDMDAQDGEVLNFQTEHAYPDAGHEPLELLVSTDWDGTEAGVATATWDVLDFTSSLEADFDSWFTFTDSGDIDLSGYSGTLYIAFRYTGSDTSNQNTTMHVDNVAVSVR